VSKQSGEKIKVAISGATGYGGLELIHLVLEHPMADITYLASHSSPGKKLEEIYPHLSGLGLTMQPIDPEQITKSADVMLMALPAGKSSELVPALLDKGMKVVDGGPDFRLKDPEAYPKWYKFNHPAPELLKEAVFGIPELHHDEIVNTRLVAGPGCYPTAALLAMAPLAKAGLIEAEVIVDAKSGISGAGRTTLKVPYLYTEATQDVMAYGFPAHRHLPEMEQEFGLALGVTPQVLFTPHLIPMTRGILATVYAKVTAESNQEALLECLSDHYKDSPFVHVTDISPHTKWTQGTNHAFVSVRLAPDGKTAILLCAIDNLGKGLSSQMVQCMNLMFGLDEATGLRTRAVYP